MNFISLDDNAYYCLECGRLFDTPKDYTERHGLDSPPYEHRSGCPYCGGDYRHFRRCDDCGKPILGEYVVLRDGSCYCENCFDLKEME